MPDGAVAVHNSDLIPFFYCIPPKKGTLPTTGSVSTQIEIISPNSRKARKFMRRAGDCVKKSGCLNALFAVIVLGLEC